jgi:hypothetical protein
MRLAGDSRLGSTTCFSIPLPVLVLLVECGGALSGLEGTFTSPGYPNPYLDDVECVWYLSVPPGFRIILTFTDFKVEDHTNCEFDNVTVYDTYTDGQGELIGR